MRNLGFMLLALATLAGCPKDAPTGAVGSYTDLKAAIEDPTELQKPEVNFQNGLFYLKPDRKTGTVDYSLAMGSFVAAGNLGGGAKAWFNAGWAAEQAGKKAEAEQYYRKAYEADPKYDNAMYSLARVLQENGKAGDAVELFRGYANAHPENVEARTDYIQALVAAGQFDEAIKEAQGILMKDPKNAAVYRNLSGLYYTKGNYSMSQLTGEKALQLNDSDPGVYNNMGVTFLLQKQEAAAIEKFKMALKLDAKNFEANMNLGWVALSSGDYGLALQCFQSATETNPTSLDAKMGLAVATRGTGDYVEADRLYREIIAADRMNGAAYMNASTLHSRYTKDFGKALEYLEQYKTARAGQLSPSDPVFEQIEQVGKLKAAEDARIAEEKRKAQEAEERKKRAEALLAEMGTQVAALKTKIAANTSCLDPGSVEEMGMVVEQAEMVLEAKDTDMAADMKGMVDAYTSALDETLAAGCAGGAPPGDAPAPEGAPTEGAPAEGTPDAPPADAPAPAPQ